MSQLDLFHVQTPEIDALTRKASVQLRHHGIKIKGGLCRHMGAISHRVEWERDIKRYPEPRPSGPATCWAAYCHAKPRLAMTASACNQYRER